jgi:hypothetical protein
MTRKIVESEDAGMSLSTEEKVEEPRFTDAERLDRLEAFMVSTVEGISGSIQMMGVIRALNMGEDGKGEEPTLTFTEVRDLLLAILKDATNAAVPEDTEAE